jgi:pyruvate/2-oxoglutarate dehydrogenase complex dihydrolipoamide acyltransferase (E2) component
MPIVLTPAVDGKVQVRHAIAGAAARTGVDFGFLYSQAQLESALDPEARAPTSSAAGLFQFTKQTWLATLKRHGRAHGADWAADAIRRNADGSHSVADPALRDAVFNLRFDPALSSAMAAEFALDNKDFLEGAIGRAAEPVDLYLAHFLGAGGAADFLKAHDADPDAVAALAFPAAAAANRSVFYDAAGRGRSFSEVRSRFAERMATAGAAAPAPSTMDFVSARSVRARQAQIALSPADPGLRPFEKMPGRLSVGFAAAAYERLATLGPGRNG